MADNPYLDRASETASPTATDNPYLEGLKEPEGPSVALDVAKQAVTAPIKGFLEAPTVVPRVLGAVGHMIGDEQFAESEKNLAGEKLWTPADLFPKAETVPGQYVETIGEFFGNPASLAGKGKLLPKALTTGTAALTSETAGQATKDTEAEPWARLLGAIAGGAAPGAALRARTPFPAKATDAERHRLNAILEREGVTVPAGNVIGSKAVRYSESELGDAPFAGGKATEANERMLQEYTDAVLRRIQVGRHRDEPLTEAIARGGDRIGQRFDTLAARNRADYDQRYSQDLLDAANNYEYLIRDPMRNAVVNHVLLEQINHIRANRGGMDGRVYQSARSRIENIRRNTKDADTRLFLTEVRQAMDDLMERGIRQNNPSDLGAWREVRNLYRNLMPIERVGAAGGEAAALGGISPKQMRQAITSSRADRRSYARGAGDYADLVRAGQALMTPLPQSGTGPRWFARTVPTAAGGMLVGGGTTELPKFVGALGAPALAGRAIHNPAVQRWLKNQDAAAARRAVGATAPVRRALSPGAAGAMNAADRALAERQQP